MNSWLIMKHSKVPAKSDGEPVDDLDNRDKADSKAETAEPSEAGDEVKPRHLGRALKLCNKRMVTFSSFIKSNQELMFCQKKY